MHARFPTASAACRAVGLDLARDLIPVGPAAHYIMGGVETDLWGRTTRARPVRGGRGGLHRRPRRQPARQQLAARRAGLRRAVGSRDAGGRRRRGFWPARSAHAADQPSHGAARPPPGRLQTEDDVRDLMWDAAGLLRDREPLERRGCPPRRHVKRAVADQPADRRSPDATAPRQPRDRWTPDRARRAPADRVPRRALPGRFPRKRRCTLDGSHRGAEPKLTI